MTTIELGDAPTGYEFTGEFRLANRGDYFLHIDRDGSRVALEVLNTNAFGVPVPILRKTRWRALQGQLYYCVGNSNSVLGICTIVEDGYPNDDNRHNQYNYFATPELAEQALNKIKEILRETYDDPSNTRD